jgi:uncharacterized protein
MLTGRNSVRTCGLISLGNARAVTVYMTYVGGYPGNYDRRAGKEVRPLRPGLFICGHSNILKVMRDQALGHVHMNPGGCGHNE